MVPFMAGQSFAMGEAFGKGFQYGKRRVSSMTNAEFNASSAEKMFGETTADITKMIPAMKNAMSQFSTLQTDIILEMVKYIAQLPKEVIPEIAPVIGGALGDLPNVLFDTILKQLGILNPLPQAEARLSQPDIKAKYVALKLAINSKKSSEFIKSLTWGLHLALKNVSTSTGIGPNVPPGVTPAPPSPSNTLILDDAGNVVSTGDTRIPAKKPRAPSSVCISIRKTFEEQRALKVLMDFWQKKGSSSNVAHFRTLSNQVGARRTVLQQKYDTSACKT